MPIDDASLNRPGILAVDLAHDITDVVDGDAARDTTAAPRGPINIGQRGFDMGQQFWRSMTTSLDNVIKSNSTAQVIPSAEAIATEVLRQQREHVTEQHGTGVSKENWSEHKNEADMVRDVGLAYR
jgi:hypothetical protein